jgi:hypothetical protein
MRFLRSEGCSPVYQERPPFVGGHYSQEYREGLAQVNKTLDIISKARSYIFSFPFPPFNAAMSFYLPIVD